MTTTAPFHDFTDDDLLNQIDLIQENMAICGRRSSYTARNGALLTLLLIEADRRGLDLP